MSISCKHLVNYTQIKILLITKNCKTALILSFSCNLPNLSELSYTSEDHVTSKQPPSVTFSTFFAVTEFLPEKKGAGN